MRYGGFSDIQFRGKSSRKHCVERSNVMIQNTPVSATIWLLFMKMLSRTFPNLKLNYLSVKFPFCVFDSLGELFSSAHVLLIAKCKKTRTKQKRPSEHKQRFFLLKCYLISSLFVYLIR